jgi:glycosyltransferase involved in cell wall biosynthesis
VKKPKICLVEPHSEHEEVLAPLIDLLYEDYDIYVIAPRELLKADLLSGMSHRFEGIPFEWSQKSSKLRRLLRMPGKYRDIRRIIDSIQPDAVLFNSSYKALDMLLIAWHLRGVRKAHIIHNFQYFLRWGMSWIYRQFDLGLVISEEVYSYVVGKHPQYRTLDYFLPIYFDSIRALPRPVDPSAKPDDLFHLGVFGVLHQDRRNYDGLFKSLAEWRQSGRETNFMVHLVGSAPPRYRDLIARHDLGGMVRCYDSFVPFEEMHRILRGIDLVLFLIDNSVPNGQFYNRYKISGTSCLVKGFRKACACSRDFPVDAVLADKCFFYDGAHVEQLFEGIANGTITKAAIRKMESLYADATILSRDYQKTRLLSAIQRTFQ